MKKINFDSTKVTFMMWLIVSLVSNIVLGKFGSKLAAIVVCLFLYILAFGLFMRSDIIEYVKNSKTPVISLCVTMLTLWVIVAFISASSTVGQAWLLIRGVALLLLVYSSAPITYLALYLGNSIDEVAQTVIPVVFAMLLVFRLLFLFTYNRALKKNKNGKMKK